MKRILYLPLFIIVFASCKKSSYSDYTPATADSTATVKVTTTNTTTGTTSQLEVPPAGRFTPINVNIPTQGMSMVLDGSTLKVTYVESVTLLTQTASLKQSYAVHFTQDFTNSDLGSFDYRSYTREGVYALNWVDDNLNNINKTEIDTTINNVPVTEISVTRQFDFFHTFDSVAAAQAEYNKLLADTTQTIGFSAYYAPVDPNSPTFIGKAAISFTAGK